MAIDFPQPGYNDSTDVHACIRLISESVDPDAITQTLGVSPSYTHTGDERPSQQPGWFLNTKGEVESAELRDHIRHLTGQLLPVRDQFLTVCAVHQVEPSLFCFALNPTSVSISLDADTVRELTALGLDYGVDLYISDPSTNGHCHIREQRQRLIDRLNSSVRRPGMFGDLQAQTDILDLAFIDRAERKLELIGRRLVERGWWSETGIRGALEQTFGEVTCANSICQAPLVEVGLKLGWIELDRQLERAEYWRLSNGTQRWLDERPRSSDDLEAEYGSPSIKIGGTGDVSFGFGTSNPTLPLIWFDRLSNGGIASLRRAGDTILDEFIFGQPATFDAAAAARNVEARRNAPNPFRQNSSQDSSR